MHTTSTTNIGPTEGPLAEKAAVTIDRLTSGAHQAVDRAAAAASATVAHVGARGDELRVTGERWIENARAYATEHPFAVAGMAFAIGFLFSRLSR